MDYSGLDENKTDAKRLRCTAAQLPVGDCPVLASLSGVALDFWACSTRSLLICADVLFFRQMFCSLGGCFVSIIKYIIIIINRVGGTF